VIRLITAKKKTDLFNITRVKPNKKKDKISFILNYIGKNFLYLVNPLTKEIKKIAIREDFKQPIQCHWLNENTLLILTSLEKNSNQEIWLFNIHTNEYSKVKIPLRLIEEPLCISSNGYEICFSTTINNLKYLFTYHLFSRKLKQIEFNDGVFGESSFWTKDGWIYLSFKECKDKKYKIIAVKEDGSSKKEVLDLSSMSNEILVDISEDGSLLAFHSDCYGIIRTAIFDTLTKQIIWYGSGYTNEIPIEISKDEQFLLAKRKIDFKTQPIIYNIDTMKQHILSNVFTIFEMHFCIDDEFLIYTRADYHSTNVVALYDLIEDTEEIIFELNPALY